uniref:7TM_GPCR_Srx domain-containing protein n=1 Tax=Parastrongyloides trichosuri TaxID=131310 RepID=A0A0N4ZJA4_PARTI
MLFLESIQKIFNFGLFYPEVSTVELVFHSLILLTTCPVIFYFVIEIMLSWLRSEEFKASLFKIIAYGKIADVITALLYFITRITKFYCPIVESLVWNKNQESFIIFWSWVKNLGYFFSTVQLTQCCYMTLIRFIGVWFDDDGTNNNHHRDKNKREFGSRVTFYVLVDVVNNVIQCVVEQVHISYNDNDPDISWKLIAGMIKPYMNDINCITTTIAMFVMFKDLRPNFCRRNEISPSA